MTDPVALLQSLIRCRSVTPADDGALGVLEAALAEAGFRAQRLTFSEPGYPDVGNLYARFGSGAPHLCFAGHTDVVPPGAETDWTHPPFAADIAGGCVWGRGAVDMKGHLPRAARRDRPAGGRFAEAGGGYCRRTDVHAGRRRP